MDNDEKNIIQEVTSEEYKWGFTTDIDTETIRKGLDEDIVRLISKKKGEPEWLLEFRLEAFRRWQKMKEPDWAHLEYESPNYQDIIYFAAPKQEKKKSMDEVDPELLATFDKLGIPLREREALAGVAYDAIMDSVSVKTTSQKALEEKGIIFMPISEAVQKHPDLVRKYLGSVVPSTDNFFAALNSAVFSDGSFCYIPKGVRCPMELSSYFRINAKGTGQFERTLIVRTGTRATRMARAASTTSSPSAASARGRTRSSAGRRWRRVLPSRGNIRRAYCREMIPRQSSILSL